MTDSDLLLIRYLIKESEEKIMSELSDAIAGLNSSLDAAVTRVQDDVQSLRDEVAALQQKVAEGVATPEDLAALAELKTKIDAIDPTKETTLPPTG